MADETTCKAADCDKAVRAKGYCDRHYRSWRKGKMGKPRHRSCNEAGLRQGAAAARAVRRPLRQAPQQGGRAEAAPAS